MGEQHKENSSALPIIDLGKFTDSDPNGRLEVSQRLVQVCHDVGFCYIANHGLPQSDIDKAFQWTRKFYDLPEAVFESIKRPEDSTSFLGWHAIGKLTPREGGIDTTVRRSECNTAPSYTKNLPSNNLTTGAMPTLMSKAAGLTIPKSPASTPGLNTSMNSAGPSLRRSSER